MAYDEHTAERVRKMLTGRVSFTEKHMFGGVAFMVRGHMAIGVNKTDLMVKVGKPNHDEAIAQPHAREMDFTKRPMKGFVFVDPDGFQTDPDLKSWVDRAVKFNATLDPK